MADQTISRPKHSNFSDQDWLVYSQFWHPVSFISELQKDKPFGIVLLDVPLVLYRTSTGVIAAQRACPHRGADLAQGWIEDDAINCPYHGFQYDSNGKCIKLPFAGDDAVKIPEKLCLQTFRVEERYNLIWVCLNPEPFAPLPDWHELENPEGYQLLEIPAINWNSSAGRQTENFSDQAHESVLHRNSAGQYINPIKYSREAWMVSETEYGARMIICDSKVDKSEQLVSQREFVVPHAASLTITMPGNEILKYFDAVCPISTDKCRSFFQAAKNYHLDDSLEEWLAFENQILEEDRQAMEAIYPLAVPFARDAEVHTLADQYCVAYRRKLQAFGLESMGESSGHWYDVKGWRYYPGGFKF